MPTKNYTEVFKGVLWEHNDKRNVHYNMNPTIQCAVSLCCWCYGYKNAICHYS